jgi:hypothetical protein
MPPTAFWTLPKNFLRKAEFRLMILLPFIDSFGGFET